MPYVSSALQSLERIFQEGGLISDSADILHLEDFERDLKALIQEVHWFLSMQRISSENETPLREAKQVVETHMRKLLSSELSDCVSWVLKLKKKESILSLSSQLFTVISFPPNSRRLITDFAVVLTPYWWHARINKSPGTPPISPLTGSELHS